MHGRRKLLDNVASLYLLQGTNYVVPLAVLPYLVRVLGIEVYGLIAFVQSFVQYFSVLTDYGFNFTATRSIAKNRTDCSEVAGIFCRVMAIKTVLALIAAAMLFSLTLLVERFRGDFAFFAIGFIAVVGNLLFPVWYFQGMEEMRYISILTGVSRLVTAAMLFVFVRSPRDGLLALSIQACGVLFSGVWGFWIVIRRVFPYASVPNSRELWISAREGWHLFVSTAAISLYTNTNVFLVGILAGNVEAGYFSAAEKLIRAATGMISPISQAIFPHISSLASASRERALRFIEGSAKWLAGLTIIPSLAMLFFAGPIAELLFGIRAAAGAAPVIQWIAMLPFIVAISNVLGVQTMVTFGLDKQFSWILLSSGVVNILFAIPLILFFGAQGAGVALLITELLVTILMIYVLRARGIKVFVGNEVRA